MVAIPRVGDFKFVKLDFSTNELLRESKALCLLKYPDKKITDKFVINTALKNFLRCENGRTRNKS